MSLFVNPAQFRPGEDLDAYPRDEARDVELAEAHGVDLVYAPEPSEVYPRGLRDHGRGRRRADRGARRRSRRGAAASTSAASRRWSPSSSTPSVPTLAFFGQKDAQQALVIRRMVRDLDFAVEIVVLPTVRAADGLALSSRNAYLDAEQRQRAAALSRALAAAERAAAGRRLDRRGAGRRRAPSSTPRGSSRSTSRPATPRAWRRRQASTDGRCWSPSRRGSGPRV